MKENWKYIEGYNDRYMISDISSVKSFHNNGRILKPGLNNGYSCVALSMYGAAKSHKVHRLVAIAFIPNPENKPQVNHKDGNKLNNNVSNLEWVTDVENRQHAAKNGLMRSGTKHHASKLTMKKARDIRLKKSEGCRIVDLSREYKVDTKTIAEVIKNINWKERNLIR